MKSILIFFDRLEDVVRSKLSRHPIIYALIGGVGVVLFWRGVWHLADEVSLSSVASIIIGTVILLLTGVFVSAFIGSRIILSGLKGEEKIVEKTEEEMKVEEKKIERIEETLKKVERELSGIEKDIEDHSHPTHYHKQ